MIEEEARLTCPEVTNRPRQELIARPLYAVPHVGRDSGNRPDRCAEGNCVEASSARAVPGSRFAATWLDIPLGLRQRATADYACRTDIVGPERGTRANSRYLRGRELRNGEQAWVRARSSRN